MLPREIWLKISLHLEHKSIILLSQTCKSLSQIMRDDFLWLSIATRDYPNLKPLLMTVYKNNPLESMLMYYQLFLTKYGHLHGFWQQDYSFFYGGLIQIVFGPKDLLRVRLLEPIHSRVEHVEPFSLDNSITVDLSPGLSFDYKYLGRLNTQMELECLSRTDIHKLTIENVAIQEEPGMLSPDVSAIEVSERIQSNRFPLGQPSRTTGLWPYPSPHSISEETLSSSPRQSTLITDERRVVRLQCAHNCHCQRVRSVMMNSEGIAVPHTLLYTPAISKILLSPSPHDQLDIALDSIWLGAYGSHGTEFIYLTVGSEPFEADNRPCLIAYKLTGDVNVPRGEITFYCPIDVKSQYIGSSERRYPLKDSTEFKNMFAFAGHGRVAMMGFRDPTLVNCDVIVKSRTEIFIFWRELQCISRLEALVPIQVSN
ncbi:hypothetical protein EDD86DRAFT_212346 [Gorgonomyces haynaldii]|nr:hypothetical protein EDD86DRAFT_212346 [Gorgonomyces haynaldii]